jgi:hypothetical protein
LVVLVSFLPDGVAAKPVKQQYQDLKITFTAVKGGDTANKIHLVLVDGAGKALSKFKVQVKADGFNTIASSDDFVLTSTSGAIADGATVTIRIKGVAAYNGKIGLQSAVFQSGDTVVGHGAATGGGLAGDPIYTIYNDLVPSFDFRIGNLLFYYDHPEVDFDTLDPSVVIDTTGIPQVGAILGGPGTFADYTVPPIADGMFFIAQGQIFLEGETTPIGWFVNVYTTTAIPEPPSIALLLTGFAGAGIIIGWISRRRSGGHCALAA